MERLSITELHQRLSQVADKVLESGNPVMIEHRGKTLLLMVEAANNSRLAALKRRKLIKGDVTNLAQTKVGEWSGPKSPT